LKGKLIIIGAIVIAVLVFVPGSFKTVTDVITHQLTNDKKQSDSNPSSKTPDSNKLPGFGGTLVNEPNSQTPASQSSAQSNSGKTPDNSQSPSTTGTTTGTTTPTGTTPTSSSGGGSQPTTGTTTPTSSSGGGSQHPTVTPTNSLSSDANPNLPSSIADYYTVIQLKSSQQGNNVLITYDDTSKKTTSVVVSLKNSDKEIFSGTFASSMFQATIEDVPNTPHIIEMTVQHSVYGTLHGSTYVPAGNSNSTISGIFTKS
jgi:hypothetical protein